MGSRRSDLRGTTTNFWAPHCHLKSPLNYNRKNGVPTNSWSHRTLLVRRYPTPNSKLNEEDIEVDRSIYLENNNKTAKMLDPTGLYWKFVGPTNPRILVPELPAFRPFGLSHHDSDWIKFGMFSPPRVGWSVARSQPKVLLTLLLALPCHVQPSPSSGAEQLAQPPSLPSRQEFGFSRQLQVTSGAKIRGDLLVGVPLTLLLPTIGYNTEYKSRWREKGGKQERKFTEAEDEEIHSNRLEEQERKFDSENPEYFFNPISGPLLSRIDTLFFYLQVHDEECRQRAICEIVQNHLKFSPLSDFLVSLFRKSRSHFLNDEKQNLVRWDRYFYAASLGQNSDDLNSKCQTRYNSCPLGADQMMNMPALRLWQLAAEKISIRIEDQ